MRKTWTVRRSRRALTRLTVALLAATGLALSGSGTAQATVITEIPAPAADGVSATVKFHGTVVPKHYNPDPNAHFGDRKCQNTYHDYLPTPGCGGFQVGVELHNVRTQPGYIAGLRSTDDYFDAYADTARTFGCLRPDGSFDHGTAFVVRTEQQPLQYVYYTTQTSWVLYQQAQYPNYDTGPSFYMNFPAVEVNCPEGMTPTQYGLKVTNLKVTVEDDNVFDHTTWSTPGPFYG